MAVAVVGGTAPFQYQFNSQPFQSENTLSGLRAGAYTVVARDLRGCTATANVTVTQPVPLSLTATPTSSRCAGGDDGTIVAVASGGNGGPFRYSLNFQTTPQPTGLFTNLKANTLYTVVAADQRDCIVAREVTIPQPNSYTISLTAQPAKCAGSADGTVAISVRGGTGNLIYRIGNGPFQSGTLFTGLAANTYEVTVQDANGCQGRESIAVGQPTPLRLTATSTPINCFGLTSGTASVTASGGTGAVTYRLTTAPASQTSTVFTGLGTGEYTIVGTDANGCTTPVSVTVGRADVLRVQAAMTPATCCVCPTGAVRLSSTGGSGATRQYQIIGQPYQANAQFAGLRPNAYQLRVADEVGCTDTVTVRVTDASAMTLTTGTIKNVLCAGGSDGEAAVQVAGGTRPFTFFWQTERKDTLQTRTATQTNLPEGTYTVSVLDSNRCTTSTVFVTLRSQFPVPTKPTVQLSGGALLVDQTVGIQWYVQQGTNPARPVPNATRPVLTPFESGQYYVVITANGCSSPPSDRVNFVLTATPEPVADFTVRVAPNPVSGGQLRVELEQAQRSAVSLNLLDASGRVIWQQQVPAFTGKKQATWPLTGISTGTYLLKADADSRRAVLRVVVE
ncbi:hypothetical protein AWR27_05080 [Spirosoma montaniterrae]|uniref:Secretion system C-terminal sorting domain-containing protein n=1 Tax=Spirosoma montaniterrae TaxID=1178516 RepID=A0A1P9X3W8_9BACT|nr:hypothetical protein AWR27_05080 [Spirosoma montaniterrae]